MPLAARKTCEAVSLLKILKAGFSSPLPRERVSVSRRTGEWSSRIHPVSASTHAAAVAAAAGSRLVAARNTPAYQRTYSERVAGSIL
jgi:hypothetical protein